MRIDATVRTHDQRFANLLSDLLVRIGFLQSRDEIFHELPTIYLLDGLDGRDAVADSSTEFFELHGLERIVAFKNPEGLLEEVVH